MKTKYKTIAIDGPAGSGKSTIANELAKRHGYLYLDTGVMYRAVTWAVLENNIPVVDEDAVTVVAQEISLKILAPTVDDGREYTVMVADADVTWLIRQENVNANVALVSSYRQVRYFLTEKQRQIAHGIPIIMVGRDIGTVVLPDADLKIFLEASPEVRAERRYKQNIKHGKSITFEESLAGIIERDKQDREKQIGAMIQAEDAVIIDTNDLTIEEVLTKIDRL